MNKESGTKCVKNILKLTKMGYDDKMNLRCGNANREVEHEERRRKNRED